ncbi:MAG: MerR family transcriptional regulator [Tenericutes bacterium HGW-Tenericutes-1]|jgi:DNA-binding transcriptional MerR regulator|nr:MAG: MerR family transcriptional regulator [Tenericutes bacterium HGW-Tenericutes-1]
MDYTVKKLSEIAGVSGRTLRFYDQIGLLKPKYINDSGYRVYGDNEVDLLQQILFFKTLGMPLESIKVTILNPNYNPIKSLEMHYEKLVKEKNHIDQLLIDIQLTIESKKKGLPMDNNLKFKALKVKQLEENEKKYGKEIRERYGTEVVIESNIKFSEMNQETYQNADELSKKIFEYLLKAMDNSDITCEEAKQAVLFHKEWLMIYWKEYSVIAHRGLGDMYLSDERFKSYYDSARVGSAQFLRDAIYYHTTV